MTETLKCITPVDGSVYVERPLAREAEVAEALAAARAAQAGWRHTPVAERQALLTAAVDAFVARKAEISEEIAPRRASPASSGAIPWVWPSLSRPGTTPI
jgi:acyl-CoA reductase-like NAD-dependent aldehyde dehydrogenase